MLKPKFTADDVEILNRTAVYQGHYRLDNLQIRHRLFSGGWSSPLLREVFERGHSVAVLLFDPNLDKLVFIEQFRVGIVTKTTQPWLIEIVAGMLDQCDEKPIAAAKREVYEETGLELLDVLPICEYWVSPGASSEKLFLFCGRVDASKVTSIHGLAAEGEDIYVHSLSVPIAYRYLTEGLIQHSSTLIALQWFQLHEQALSKRWQAV